MRLPHVRLLPPRSSVVPPPEFFKAAFTLVLLALQPWSLVSCSSCSPSSSQVCSNDPSQPHNHATYSTITCSTSETPFPAGEKGTLNWDGWRCVSAALVPHRPPRLSPRLPQANQQHGRRAPLLLDQERVPCGRRGGRVCPVTRAARPSLSRRRHVPHPLLGRMGPSSASIRCTSPPSLPLTASPPSVSQSIILYAPCTPRTRALPTIFTSLLWFWGTRWAMHSACTTQSSRPNLPFLPSQRSPTST